MLCASGSNRHYGLVPKTSPTSPRSTSLSSPSSTTVTGGLWVQTVQKYPGIPRACTPDFRMQPTTLAVPPEDGLGDFQRGLVGDPDAADLTWGHAASLHVPGDLGAAAVDQDDPVSSADEPGYFRRKAHRVIHLTDRVPAELDDVDVIHRAQLAYSALLCT